MKTNALFENFEDYVASLMRKWQIPGAAVGIVHKDRVILAAGYGVRKLGSAELIDDQTMFGIGSLTKALATTLIAKLVDDGTMDWDARVTDYLPTFRLFDENASKLVTIRDIITHRTGLPPTAALFRYETPITSDEVTFRLRYIKPLNPFRSRFCYNDAAFVTLGQCTEVANGMKWSDLIRQKLFVPLHMNSSHTSTSELKTALNVTSAHTLVDGTVQPVEYRHKDNTLAASSANSNLTDVIRFVQLHLAGGVSDGTRLISEVNFHELYSPQIPIPGRKRDELLNAVRNLLHAKQPLAEQEWSGLGWVISNYRGHQIIRRLGSLPGIRTSLILLPELCVGIVVLANSDATGGGFLKTLSYRIAEALLELPPRDSDKPTSHKVQQDRAKDKPKTRVEKPPQSAVHLEQYVGTYRDCVLGDAQITMAPEGMLLAYGSLLGDLKHLRATQFDITWRDPYMRQHKMLAEFFVDKNGKVNKLEFSGDGTFERIAERPPASSTAEEI